MKPNANGKRISDFVRKTRSDKPGCLTVTETKNSVKTTQYKGEDVQTTKIEDLIEKISRAVYPDRGPSHIHPVQWMIMRHISGCEQGYSTVGEIADALGNTHAPASRAVASLSRKGFVNVEVCEYDKRVRRVSLAPAGEAQLVHDPINRLITIVETLEKDDRDSLRWGLFRLSELLTELDGEDDAAE